MSTLVCVTDHGFAKTLRTVGSIEGHVVEASGKDIDFKIPMWRRKFACQQPIA